MQLYGSSPSPYVRRIRLVLAAQPYEFMTLNIFETTDRATLIRLNPTRKVPMLVDGDAVIYDSSVIYRYLAAKYGWVALTWQQENVLTLINAVNDSLVELLLCQRSGFDTNEDRLFFNLQHERIAAVLTQLEQMSWDEWNYVTMSLYALVDWAAFRGLVDLTPYPRLRETLVKHADQPAVQQTDPRLAS